MVIKTDNATKTIRVACYCRVSTQEQAQHGVSLAEQQERLKAWAAMEGWQIANFYIDEGLSAKDDNRPQLQNLILDAKARRFDLVIVSKLDRLMRNVRLLLNLIDNLKQSGVAIAAQADGIDTRDHKNGNIVLNVLASMAEWERERIGERIKDARTHLTAKGQWSSGRTPYGYRFNKSTKQLEIEEKEAEAIRYVFDQYTQNKMGIDSLAKLMNSTSYMPPRAFRKHQKSDYWTATTTLHVLTHPAYMGGPNEHWKYKTPAIITPETWKAAEIKRKSNICYKPSDMGKTQYQGRLVCGICGRHLQIAYNGGHRKVYSCPGRRALSHPNGSPLCTLPRFDAARLDKRITTKIEKMCNDPQLLVKYLQKYINNIHDSQKALEEQLKPLDAEAVTVNEEIDIINAKLEMRQIKPEIYKFRMSNLQKRLADIEERKNNLDPTDALITRANDTMTHSMIKVNDALIDAYQSFIDMIHRGVIPVAEITEMLSMFKLSPTLPGGEDIVSEMVKNAFKDIIVYPDKIELKGSLSMRKLNSLSVLE